MSTTSKFSSDGAARPCSAKVEYKERQGPCQRDAKYPDADGIRWWCGLHNPDRPKARLAADSGAQSAVDRNVLVGIKQVDEKHDEMIAALEEARMVLTELSSIRDIGWPPNTPVEKYKVMMNHAADRALEASRSLGEKISRLRS